MSDRWQKGFIRSRKTKTKGWVQIMMYREQWPDGTWHQKSETIVTASRKEARKKLDERLAEVNGGTVVTPSATTFAGFVAEHWGPHAADTIKPSTRKGYQSMLKHHLLPALGSRKLRDIQPSILAKLLHEKRAAGKSQKFRLNLYLLLGAIFNYACDQKLLVTSPLSPSDRPPVEKTEKPTLEPTQIEAIINALPPRWRPLFVVLTLTGLRIGEVLALKWSDVDFDKGKLHIRRSVWMGKDQTPKTKRSVRAKPLVGLLCRALQAQRAITLYSAPEDYCFCAGNGHALYPDDVRKRVLYPAMDQAGIARQPRCHGFHLLRHSAGTQMQQVTGNLKSTSSFLGHASTATTGDIYAHTLPDVAQADMESLESALFPRGISENLLSIVAKTDPMPV